ncbi:unnamed protein product [Ceratitis capitata]|uniref:(Mediterranean fruit fly) hypothetical protein n=1 Tax=Ceratitis capitata TaxID=7213 RepID=A0A811UE85_CERCA|nr:unnamed protein product [Ceratitis capitata]
MEVQETHGSEESQQKLKLRREARRRKILENAKNRLEKLNMRQSGEGDTEILKECSNHQLQQDIEYSDPEVEPNIPEPQHMPFQQFDENFLKGFESSLNRQDTREKENTFIKFKLHVILAVTVAYVASVLLNTSAEIGSTYSHNTSNKNADYSCARCGEIDNDEWVGVNSNVADKSWCCEICNHIESTANAQPTASSSPAAKQGATAAKSSQPKMAPACWVSEPTLTFSLSQNRQLPTMATGRYSTPPAMVSPTQFLPDNVATPSGNTMAPSSNAHDEQGTTIVHLAHRPRNQAVYQKLQLERLEEEMRIQQQFIFLWVIITPHQRSWSFLNSSQFLMQIQTNRRFSPTASKTVLLLLATLMPRI